MSDIELIQVLIERLTEVPRDKALAYEMVSAYDMAFTLVDALTRHGVHLIQVKNENCRHKILIQVEDGYFPVRCSEDLPPGTFILQPL